MYLLIDDDVHLVQGFAFNQPLDGIESHPQVVCVEDLELLDGLELIHLGLWNLGDLQQLGLPLVVNEGASLDIGTGLIRDLHYKLVS